MTEEKTKVLMNDNSKGVIPDYYAGFDQTRRLGMPGLGKKSSFDIKKALDVIKNDPVVKAGITTLSDKTLEPEWAIFDLKSNKRNKDKEEELKKKRFNKLLKKLVPNLFLYNNAFIEIVKKNEQLSDLNLLEATLMEIDPKNNGDILGYYQFVPGLTNAKKTDYPYWTPDKLTHIKLREITNNVWAEPLDIQGLYETVMIKEYIRQWLQWFFGTNQLRGLLVLENGAKDATIKDFVSYLKASEQDRSKPIILTGKVTYQLLNSFKDSSDGILKLLEWCDSQILMLLQVPPIAVGQPDSSGRSNSNEQFQSLNTTILNVQRLLEDEFTYDLFPKIGFDGFRFEFGILDETARQRTFEIAEKMRNMMMTDEAITEFLASQRIVFETDKLFKDPAEEAQKMAAAIPVAKGNEGMVGKKSHDSAPSRRRQDSVGNSKISKANTSVMMNSFDEEKYSKYPYVYEVEKDED